MLDLNPQACNARILVTRRWNCLHLDKPQRRWEIPDDILHLAKTEPLAQTVVQRRQRRGVDLATGEQSDPGRTYTEAEREAFISVHRDIAAVQAPAAETEWRWGWGFRHASAERAAREGLRGYSA